MNKQNNRWRWSGLLLVLLFFFVGVVPVRAVAMEYEEYRSQLELEYFIPFIMYDGVFYAATYGKMSSILRDQELEFILLAQGEETINLVLGYTYHTPYWSYGLNFYQMPVFTGPPWGLGFWELQRGVSLLASRHYSNEDRLDLRLQWESFSPLEDFRYPVDDASLFGVEATLTHDDFSFLRQAGSRGYVSLGGAYPLLGTAYENIKVEGDYRRYWSGDRTSLIFCLRTGKIWGYYPSHRGFALGGIQQVNVSSLGTVTNQGLLGTLADTVLRGYPAYRYRGDGFILTNLELRLLAWPRSYQERRRTAFSLGAFADAAWVWDGDRRVSASPSVGVGFGFKFFLFGLNIGFDYAVPLNSEDRAPRWHFSLGEVF
ncbi:BamA/TamA family outer membrane protein [Capillibacterium thermochitinicola]|uniref:BamA/TamA family outer membrane protein n=1 Tax=Capillibacterium thermochitinicola TaxID=2699427 RepID=A0A8J6I148_9FIRM|nr:BamA/TamA family outer membrane protein [Capillibacterium thermochitinicola]MBA2133740.1 BamA/TamA family outer membrane protein [Capillibacterium thermochitinicola]